MKTLPCTLLAALWLVAQPLLAMPLAQPADAAGLDLTAEVARTVQVAEVPRIGINIGRWTYWGAEQLSRNILKNPGFEGIIDRALVRVAQASRRRFSDDQTWLARPDGFWAGGRYEVLTGASVGASGSIVDSRAAGSDGLPEFIVTGPLPQRPAPAPASVPPGLAAPAATASAARAGAAPAAASMPAPARQPLWLDLAPGDIVAVTRVRDGLPPTHWWLPAASDGLVRPDPRLIAPGSPGRRSLLLAPLAGRTLRLSSHLDSIGERAGKLLPVQGPWRLSLWLHGDAQASTEVRLLFRRHGSTPFLDLTLTPAPGWQLVEQQFEAEDAGPIGRLEFSIEVRGDGEVRVDDCWLGPVATPTTEANGGETAGDDAGDQAGATRPALAAAFRPEVLTALQRLQPGYLRDWQGQLGDTLDNRLAPPFARRASRYRPGSGSEFGYGLAEFLDLCRAVAARPWLVMPTTFSPAEAQRLGAWLAARAEQDGFDEVLVEFGNENWNAVFRPAGIQDPDRHGAAADRLFAALQAGADGHPALRAVVNTQHVNPWLARRTGAATAEADLLAIAPYLLHRLDGSDTGSDPAQALDLLFADDGGLMQQIAAELPASLELAVYEVNLHSTRGDATATHRAAVVAGAAAGPALAKRLLEAMALGARRQAVYRLAGFDTPIDDHTHLVPLFGVTRDLVSGTHLRPTGWAVALLNQVIAGDLHQVDGSATEHLMIAPFHGPAGWSAAIVSPQATPVTLTLDFPSSGGPAPRQAEMLDASLPFQNNETEQPVQPQPLALTALDAQRVRLTLPPWSLVVLLPPGAAP